MRSADWGRHLSKGQVLEDKQRMGVTTDSDYLGASCTWGRAPSSQGRKAVEQLGWLVSWAG